MRNPDPAPEPPAGRRRPRFRLGASRAGGRYTRFVALMRIVLPVFAGVLALLVVIWPQFGEDSKKFRLLDPGGLSLQEGGDQQAVNPRFTGVDQQSRPFTVTADSALQTQVRLDEITLAFPKADLTMKNGAWVALSAANGLYFRQRQQLELNGDVNLFHDSGIELRTSAAHIDFTTSEATSDQPVQGQGPFGTLDAKGFHLYDGGKRIVFQGPSKLLFWPQPRGDDK